MGQLHGKMLHRDLAVHTQKLVERIAGPTIRRAAVIDQLLDIRNLGRGRDLGLELTVDDMLESVPGHAEVSAEWWLSCLNDITDHATFLAAGYPPAPSSLVAA